MCSRQSVYDPESNCNPQNTLILLLNCLFCLHLSPYSDHQPVFFINSMHFIKKTFFLKHYFHNWTWAPETTMQYAESHWGRIIMDINRIQVFPFSYGVKKMFFSFLNKILCYGTNPIIYFIHLQISAYFFPCSQMMYNAIRCSGKGVIISFKCYEKFLKMLTWEYDQHHQYFSSHL